MIKLKNIIKEIENKIEKLQKDIKNLNNINSLSKTERLELIKNTPLRYNGLAMDILKQDIPFNDHKTTRTKDANFYNIFLNNYIIKVPLSAYRDIIIEYINKDAIANANYLKRLWDENIIIKNDLIDDKNNLILKSKNIFYKLKLKSINSSIEKIEESIKIIDAKVINSKNDYYAAISEINKNQLEFIEIIKIELKDYLKNGYKLDTRDLMNFQNRIKHYGIIDGKNNRWI